MGYFRAKRFNYQTISDKNFTRYYTILSAFSSLKLVFFEVV